ncbi:hypothetical protein LINGRAHAP2_LOCUS20198, partial [Linum grandiflorum]
LASPITDLEFGINSSDFLFRSYGHRRNCSELLTPPFPPFTVCGLTLMKIVSKGTPTQNMLLI